MLDKDYKQFLSKVAALCEKSGYFWVIEGDKRKGAVHFYDLADPEYKQLHSFVQTVMDDLKKPRTTTDVPRKTRKK